MTKLMLVYILCAFSKEDKNNELSMLNNSLLSYTIE